MSFQYDPEIFAKHKALSIKTIDELKVGQEIFVLWWDDDKMVYRKIIIDALLTNRERYAAEGRLYRGNDPDEILWIKVGEDFNGPRSYLGYAALPDMNIGASYNPWLAFAEEERAKQAANEIKITYVIDTDDLEAERFEREGNY